ncbi:MazG nucleotide pyrophosphohydrolase domain-containing protein [Levilactobacillus tangyuanensis]|uniref:MazG nucleotide pyrophosphohydrolase domain-containing protein n=1 Tax=Levilactobacillus tangyuanensis TaxID=2486021 RepID=A0ABW1TP61_9LACO|nr:MazG nucleotide pyrophosphohydrolase domain-containing protein [Levilactobacillus tangyuanensis]
MDLMTHQAWLVRFYRSRQWYQYSPFIRLNFLTEEVGELSRAIRAIEIGRDHPGEADRTPADLTANLEEELGDVLDQVLILSHKFNVSPERLLAASEQKLRARFDESAT